MEEKPLSHTPHSPSPANNTLCNTNDPKSPEFEFWMVRNPSFPQPHLLSADELIVNGALLPLDLVSHLSETHISQPKLVSVKDDKEAEKPEAEPELSRPGPGPESSSSSSSSKRWTDIFKISTTEKDKKKEKPKKKGRKSSNNASSTSSGVSSGAELNINIWPFSRTWSGGNRSSLGVGPVGRKVSSAPCSRSNSASESRTRRLINSPSRTGGIHLGRNSPVFQVRRGGSGLRNAEPARVTVGADTSRVLDLNAATCMSRLHYSGDESSPTLGSGAMGSSTNFSFLRTLFNKKSAISV